MVKQHRKRVRRFLEKEMSIEDFELILEELEDEGLSFRGLEAGKTSAGEPFKQWLSISVDALALGYVRACAKSDALLITIYSHREQWDVESVREETGQKEWLPPNYERAAQVLADKIKRKLDEDRGVMEPERYPKESEFVLDCGLDEAVSILETFWVSQETLEPLKLQKDDGPPGVTTTYRVMETVGGITNQRAVLRFVHRWQDERTYLSQLIYPPGGHTDGLFFPVGGGYPSFLETTLVEELERFRGICPPKAAEPEPTEDDFSFGGRTMADRVVFRLNTSAYNFAQWLETHTSVQEFPTERGRFVLQRARAGGNFYKPNGITVDSAYITPSRDDEQMEICHYIGVAIIHFGLTEIGTERDSRVEVDALCANSFLPIRAYFYTLLAEIAKTWPESARPIGELALAFAKEMGVDTSQLAGEANEVDILPKPAEPAPKEGGTATTDYPTWFPKKADTIDKWREAYSHCLDLQQEYQDMYQYGELDDPKPSWGDYSDHVTKEMGWKIRSSKTIRRILKAGGNHWL